MLISWYPIHFNDERLKFSENIAITVRNCYLVTGQIELHFPAVLAPRKKNKVPLIDRRPQHRRTTTTRSCCLWATQNTAYFSIVSKQGRILEIILQMVVQGIFQKKPYLSGAPPQWAHSAPRKVDAKMPPRLQETELSRSCKLHLTILYSEISWEMW